MGRLTRLHRPIVRRLTGRRLVIRLSDEGVEIKGHGRRTWRLVSYERLATLADDEELPIVVECERQRGERVLARIGAGREPEGAEEGQDKPAEAAQ